jgi:predicted anti-sigma-YlaC factor YlaD
VSVEPTDPQEHGRIEELLAGYVLRSLSGEDAVEADRLLSTHVPTCATCRRLLLDLTETAADLAFAVEPIAPPERLRST